MTTPPVHPARRIWQQLEALHAVTYFAPECTDAMKALGLKGFWMGYFAGRAAPLGAVGPAVVEASFYNFAPSPVRRALPDAWATASPEVAIETRAAAAAGVLRAIVPGIDEAAPKIVPLLNSAVRSGRPDGRVLFAANQALTLPTDPVAALWQCATSLREHRGDGHVAALVAADISGVEAHQLVIGARLIESERLRGVRGWTEAEWSAAREQLRSRALVDSDGDLTLTGHDFRESLERVTDDLAMQPYRDGLTESGLDLLPSLLRPLARAVTTSGLLPFPNPIGLTEEPSIATGPA